MARAVGGVRQQGRQVAVGLGGDIVDRTERSRGEQGVAGPPQHANASTTGARELLDQGRLADAGLAADQDGPALATRRVRQRRLETTQGDVAFEEVHGWELPAMSERSRRGEHGYGSRPVSARQRARATVVNGLCSRDTARGRDVVAE